jgi:fermentation-respiration switch protein FrsA (DUF1100 family)
MKHLVLIIFGMIVSVISYGQDITGQWNGVLEVQGTRLRVVFHIENNMGYNATMDSPDQGVKDIPVTSVTFENNVLNMKIKKAGIEYIGTYNENETISGDFKQAGQVFPLILSREQIKEEKKIRPQDPVKPYPYNEEEITFENKDAGIILSGTLTLPKTGGPFPVVVLITGSGPQNRDEELLGHRPFLVLSDFLTRNGIAVLRYDDRGTSSSTGNFETATTVDLSEDVLSAVEYLKTRREVNGGKIGLIGHSEGGIIAPIVASKSKDISFIVLLAGTGIRGDQLLLMQQELIGRAMKISESDIVKTRTINRGAFDIVLNASDTSKLKLELKDYFKKVMADNPDMEKLEGISEEDLIDLQISELTSPWMQYFIKYDPAISLEQVKCPVLALNGEKDLQVPPDINLQAIEDALKRGGNIDVTVKKLPGLNHLFQRCESGSPDEYGIIEETFSPEALDVLLEWILRITR